MCFSEHLDETVVHSVVSRVFTNEFDGVGATTVDSTLREIYVRVQVVAAMLHT